MEQVVIKDSLGIGIKDGESDTGGQAEVLDGSVSPGE